MPGCRPICPRRLDRLDPTNGIIGTRDLIRVAVARDPHQAIPLHGAYRGAADAFVGMEVAIHVVCGR